jgi:DNA end-binding protein Ku
MWNGSVGFGLVNVPVELVTASRDLDFHFRELHEKDGSPVRHQRFCVEEERPVEWEEVGRGYELDDGRMLVLTDEELEGVAPEKNRTIEIESFTPVAQIDPIRFNHGYFLVPRDRSKGTLRAYNLLVRSMSDNGLAALGRFVMRTREYLATIRERDGALALSTMYFSDEIRPVDSIPRPDANVTEQAIDDAIAVITDRRSDWDPASFKDCYRERLRRVIEEKRRGQTVHPPDPVNADELKPAPDLMAALKETLRRSAKEGSGPGRSRKELYEQARREDVPGRSSMSKQELIEALDE